MENMLIDENEDYGIEYSKAIWASDKMHQDYHDAKVLLSDADFIIESDKSIMIVEYKNANTAKAQEFSYKTHVFNPLETDKFNSIVKKFYDSLHYINLLGKDKPVQYIYVVEIPNGDSTMRKRLRDVMKKLLPFELQKNIGIGRKLIDKVDVLSIEEWNTHSEYGKYPFVKISDNGETN